MKLLGFKEFKGEKGERKWDFVQLVIDKEEDPSNVAGGVQLLMQRRNNGYGLPSVSIETWNAAIRSGVRVGSSVRIFQEMDGTIVLTNDNVFKDIV